MTRNMESVLRTVLADEGGVKDVGDGKGLTRFGQTPQWLSQWGLVPPDTPDQAAENYEDVWQRTGIADVIDRDTTTGFILATFATHAGETTALKAFQRELGVEPDGVLGPKTFAAYSSAPEDTIAHNLAAAYGEHLFATLGNRAIDRRKDAKGWGLRYGRIIRGLV